MTRPLRLITRQAEQRRLIDVETFILSALIYAYNELAMLAKIPKFVYDDFVQFTVTRHKKLTGDSSAPNTITQTALFV